MKKDNFLINYIKSFIIGFGILLPVSASMLAVVLGLYDKILYLINNFFKCLKEDFKFILALFLGIATSCVTSILVINYVFERFPVAILLMFIGLIIGGLPAINTKLKGTYNIKNIALCVIGIIIMLLLSAVGVSQEATITLTASSAVILFLIGALAAGSMIVPGISGSAILVTLGFYKPLINIVSNTLKFVDFSTNIVIVAIFGVGMLAGLLLVSKLMDLLLKKHETASYHMIMGLIVGSIFSMIHLIIGYPFILGEFLIGVLLFIIVISIALKFLKGE